MNIEPRVAVLQAFTHGECYGLEIIERVRLLTGGKVQLTQASTYPVIQALVEEGLLATHVCGVPQRTGRPRRYYRLTAAGMRAAMKDRVAILGLLTGEYVSSS